MQADTRAPGSIEALERWWSGLKLEKQFALAAAVVLLAGMLSIGWWVANRIVRAVTESAGAAAALYMESSVAPLIQELATSDRLTEVTEVELDLLLAHPAISERIISMKILRLDGTIVYSKWRDVVGTKRPTSESFRRAAAGEVAVVFDQPDGEENTREHRITTDLFDIYAPVRETQSHRIIAVSIFCASAEHLRSNVRREIASSWLIVGHVTFFMMAGLWFIVVSGGHTIDKQRLQLSTQIGELRTLLVQNEDLRVRLQRSNATVANANEQFLRRIGADLHDGPAQLLSYTLLRLHKFAPLVERGGGDKERHELVLIRDALGDTLREVRNISEGLALPELDSLPLIEVIELAITSHERLTNTQVSSELDLLLEDAPKALKLCVYRFVQEGLANAFRHAGGKGQRVTARSGRTLEVAVSDEGPGLAGDRQQSGGLGLAGLRARIEATGGNLTIFSTADHGTRLIAYFDLSRIPNEEFA